MERDADFGHGNTAARHQTGLIFEKPFSIGIRLRAEASENLDFSCCSSGAQRDRMPASGFRSWRTGSKPTAAGHRKAARAIHAQGLRKEAMFVEVNCAAIPEDNAFNCLTRDAATADRQVPERPMAERYS